MNWGCYYLRKKWLLERGVSASQSSEQAYNYVKEKEEQERETILNGHRTRNEIAGEILLSPANS